MDIDSRILEVLEINLADARELLEYSKTTNDEHLKRRAAEDVQKWEKRLQEFQEEA